MDSSVKAWLLFAVTVAVWVGAARPAAATNFTVGDSMGWTILHSPNYTEWVSGKTFHVGDIVLFNYHKEFHNVLEVKEADYTLCKNSSAIKEYHTGEDSIVIGSAGHHYFICGFPNHCLGGQKVDILAVGSSAAPSSPPEANAGDRLAADISVFVGGLIMAVSCVIVLLGF